MSSDKEMTSVKKKAEDLGVEFLLPVMTSLLSDNKGSIIPVGACDNLMKNGYEMYAIGHLKLGLNRESPNFIPDPETFIQLPWRPEVAWMQSDAHYLGSPCAQCPRLKLKQLQQKAKEMGFVMKTGLEPEFMLLDKDKHEPLDSPRTKDLMVYHDAHETLRRFDFVSELLRIMSKLGWGPYEYEHEAIRGQYEVNYGFSEAMTTADRHSFFKFMVKELAVKHGSRATFMPFPFSGMTVGNGLHINISLWDAVKDNNLFPDDKSDTGLSELAQHFIAGILTHAEALTAVLCPNINSYKRLHGAPFIQMVGSPTISWGVGNRFAMIRIPNNERIEIRCSDSSANPYLCQAAILAAGMHGIQDKIPLDPASRLQEDIFTDRFPAHVTKMKTLPKSIQEACQHLSQDTKLMEYLGEEIVTGFLYVKNFQWEDLNKTVTPDEIAMVDEY